MEIATSKLLASYWIVLYLSLAGATRGSRGEERLQNMLRASECFDLAEWQQCMYSNWAPAEVVANAHESPTGSLTADLIKLRGPTSSRNQAVRLVSDGGTLTFSVWVKGTETATYGHGVFLNVGTGRGGKLLSPYLGNRRIDDDLDSREWRRVALTVDVPAEADEIVVGIGTIAGEATNADILAWGAQVNQGPVATDYLPTTVGSMLVTTEGEQAAAEEGSIRP